MAKIDRDEIVNRAIQLMLTGGYDGTSMAQIAAACGIRKASVYHHFPDKDALVLAAIAQIHAYFREHIFVLAYSPSPQPLSHKWERGSISAKQKLRALNRATFAFFDGREGGCLLGNFVLELMERAPQFQAPLRAYFDEWAAAIAHVLQSVYSRAKARRLAFAALAQIQGAIMLMRLYRDPRHLRRALASTLEML